MTSWRLRCQACSREWNLDVSYDLSEYERIYLYCPACRKNTMHEVLGRVD